MTCDMCGRDASDVRTVIDPFALEINEEEVEMNLCPKCEQERRDDI